MGVVSYLDSELIVTLGGYKGDCLEGCPSPEAWFYLYRTESDELSEFAAYPGYGECVLAEEDEFTLAVAPDSGSVVIDWGDNIETIAAPDRAPHFAFIPADAGAVAVAILDHNKQVSACVALGRDDPRGGLGPHPKKTPVPTVYPALVVITACTTTVSPLRPEYFSDEPFLAQGCVDAPFGQMIVARVDPSEQLAGSFYMNAW